MSLDGKISTVVIDKGNEIIEVDKSIDFYDTPKGAFERTKSLVFDSSKDHFLTPIPQVGSIRDFYTFEEHVKRARKRRGLEMVKEWYEIPAYYYSNPVMIYPSGSSVPYPSFTSQLDYEMEVAVIIGKEGVNITAESALSHILGLTLANDWSARDVQRKEMKIGLGPSKSKDFATSLGPYVTTIDELGNFISEENRFNIPVEAYVNGKRYSSGNLVDMHWSFSEVLEYASRGTRLKRGDVIMSGTISTGCILELGPEEYGWLKRGDVVSIVSPVLGELKNEVV